MTHEQRHEATDGDWPTKEESDDMKEFNITKAYATNRDTCAARRCSGRPFAEVLSDCWDVDSGNFVQLCERHTAHAKEVYQLGDVAGSVRSLVVEPEAPETESTGEEWNSLHGFPASTGAVDVATAIEVRVEQTEALEAGDLMGAFKIQTQEDLTFAADALAHAKGRYKELKAKQDVILAPMKEATKEVKALFKPSLDSYAEIERTLKALILEAKAREDEDRQLALNLAADGDASGAVDKIRHTSNVPGLSTRKRMVITVTDPSAVPSSFMMPDLAKIKSYFADDAARVEEGLPGVKAEWETTLASASK